MSDSTIVVTGHGIKLGTLLFVVFLILKLCEVINWSWWWVTAPLWAPPVIVLGVLAVAGLVGLVVWGSFRLYYRIRDRRKQ